MDLHTWRRNSGGGRLKRVKLILGLNLSGFIHGVFILILLCQYHLPTAIKEMVIKFRS